MFIPVSKLNFAFSFIYILNFCGFVPNELKKDKVHLTRYSTTKKCLNCNDIKSSMPGYQNNSNSTPYYTDLRGCKHYKMRKSVHMQKLKIKDSQN